MEKAILKTNCDKIKSLFNHLEDHLLACSFWTLFVLFFLRFLGFHYELVSLPKHNFLNGIFQTFFIEEKQAYLFGLKIPQKYIVMKFNEFMTLVIAIFAMLWTNKRFKQTQKILQHNEERLFLDKVNTLYLEIIRSLSNGEPSLHIVHCINAIQASIEEYTKDTKEDVTKKDWQKKILNFSGMHFKNIHLDGANLDGANFANANLDGVSINEYTSFAGTILKNSTLLSSSRIGSYNEMNLKIKNNLSKSHYDGAKIDDTLVLSLGMGKKETKQESSSNINGSNVESKLVREGKFRILKQGDLKNPLSNQHFCEPN